LRRCTVLISVGEPRPWRVLPYSEARPDTSSAESFHTATKWIYKCTAEHARCKIPGDTPLPTRVIDVGGLHSPSVLLYETQNEHAEYLALSHCWGGVQPLTTTTSTLSQRKKGIQIESLPKTFRDAVIFVRRLKKRYLWIDSLCIIQDDLEDWRREAAKMAEIYQGSWLTIAALKASNDLEGCFSVSTTLLNPVVGGQQFRVYAQRGKSHLAGAKGSSSDIFPLTRRAWIYQERLLSPRVLHFGHNELLWECQEASTCECPASEMDFLSAFSGQENNVESLKISHSSTLTPKATIEELQFRWYHIVQEYSALKLSRSSDKLPAVQGVAKHLNSFRKDLCLAGTWRNTLLDDLMWYVHGRGKRHEERAPSWSWSSVDGTILFARDISGNTEAQCDVSVAEYPDWSPDKHTNWFSAFTANKLSLVVSGHIIPCREVSYAEQGFGPESWYRPNYAIQIGDFERRVPFNPDTGYVGDREQGFTIPPTPDIYCLMLAVEALKDSLKHHFMVIRVMDKEKRIYKRVGLGTLLWIKTPERGHFYGIGRTTITIV